MARLSNIKLRRSATAGAIPTAGNLDLGELALNTYDGKLYMKKSVSGTDSVVEIGAAGAAASDIVKYYRFVSSGSTTTFSGSDSNSETLSYVPSAIQVSLNGILLDPTRDYTANTGNSVVLTAAAANNDIVQIAAYYKTIGDGDNVVQTFTGNGSDYSFTLNTNPVSENQTLIYIDGVYQNKSAYGISGTSLDFGSGNIPVSGAVIEVVTHSTNLTASNIANLTITGNFTTNTISASGTITGNLTGNVTGNTSGSAGTVTSLSGLDTDDLNEGSSNLYYTAARFNAALSSANTGSLAEGSNLYFTNARADARIAAANTGNLSEGSNLYYTNERVDDRVNALIVAGTNITTTYNDAAGTLTINSSGKTQEEIEDIVDNLLVAGTGITLTYNDAAGTLTVAGSAQYQDSNARAAISVTDSGGDGALAYNNSTGVITYTGPSAAEVRAHLSAGTGVTYSGGAISIGQAVATTSDVTFNDVQVDGDQVITGNLTVNGTQTNINTATLSVEDLNITVGKLATTSAATNGAGLTFGAWSSGTIPTLTWDHSNTRFAMNKPLAANIVGNVTGNVTGNVVGNVTGNITGTVSSLSNLDTDDLSEGSTNLYYTNARADARVTALLPNTGSLSEGSNLYYTNARADARIGAAVISDLSNVTTTSPTSGQILKWNGSAWAPAADLSGAANQNIFETIAVSGQSDIVTDGVADTLTFAAGTGITITTNAGTDTLTITNSAVGANAFGNIVVAGNTTVSADSTNDTLTLVAGAGMSIVTNAGTDTITISGAAASNPLGTQLHTATNGQTVFAIGNIPASEDALMVFVEGVYQNKNSYTISGSSLTFSGGIVTGDEVVIHSVANGINGTGQSVDIYTASGSQYVFSLSVDPQTENNCFVFWDGVYQEKSNYTTNSTHINFGSGNIPPSGTKIEIITPTVTAVNVPTPASVVPNSMSAGGPSWDSAGAVTISESVQNTVTTNITSTSTTNILSLPATTFRSAKVEISISDATSSDYEFVEVGMIHNGAATSSTVYGQVFTGSSENGTITSTYSSGNMILQFTSANTNTLTIKAKYSALKV